MLKTDEQLAQHMTKMTEAMRQFESNFDREMVDQLNPQAQIDELRQTKHKLDESEVQRKVLEH